MPRNARPVVLALAATLVFAAPAAAASPDVVVSQLYGGGGNTGATLKNDYIELFNRGDAPVDLTGWTVQYASALGTGWQKTALSGTIQPKRRYLVQEAAGANAGAAPLPAPDATGTIAMSASSGKVALVTNSAALSCGADCDKAAGVRDFVGYGSANDFEGAAAAPGLSNTTADLRAGNGCTDSDDNAADFTAGSPAPRNSATGRRVRRRGAAPAASAADRADPRHPGPDTHLATGRPERDHHGRRHGDAFQRLLRAGPQPGW